MLPTIACFGSLTISSLLVVVLVGVVMACYFFWHRLKELGVDEERSLEVFIACSLAGVWLARLIYIFTHLASFSFNLFRWFSVGRYPGFSLWGFGVGFLACMWLMTRRSNLGFWRLADEAVFPLLLMGVLFNLGGFLAGLEKGAETSFFWGLFFPGDMICRHPVGLVRAWAWGMIWGWARWAERRWRLWRWYPSHKEGFLVLIVTFLVSMVEVLLAFLKPSGVYSWIISHLLVLILGVAATVIFYRRSGYKRLSGRWRLKMWRR